MELTDFHKQAIAAFHNDMKACDFIGYDTDVVDRHLLRMADTPQSGPWHKEGDVLTHTFMVVNAHKQLMVEAKTYPELYSKLVLMGAWFHDFGKPDAHAWNEIKNRHTFHGHEAISTQLFRLIAWEIDWPTNHTEIVAAIVHRHGDLTTYAKQNAATSTYQKLASVVSPHLVYQLELADFKGRICDDFKLVMDLLNQFKETCEKLQIFYNNHVVDNEKHVRTFDDVDDVVLPSEDRWLILPVAVPGVGKTYFRNALLKKHKMSVVSPDDIRIELFGNIPYDPTKNNQVFGRAHYDVKQAFNDPLVKYVYFDAQNHNLKDRTHLVEMAREAGIKVCMTWFIKKPSVILKQNATRERVVDEKYIYMRLGTIQYPALNEADHIIRLRGSQSLSK